LTGTPPSRATPRHAPPSLLTSRDYWSLASAPSGSDIKEKQTITFDRFLRACVFMKQFNESFAHLDTDKDGTVQMDYNQFLTFYFLLP
jgi:hypothetical protein